MIKNLDEINEFVCMITKDSKSVDYAKTDSALKKGVWKHRNTAPVNPSDIVNSRTDEVLIYVKGDEVSEEVAAELSYIYQGCLTDHDENFELKRQGDYDVCVRKGKKGFDYIAEEVIEPERDLAIGR